MRQPNFLSRHHRPMESVIACHDCDLLLTLPELTMGVVAECPRCGAFLRRTQFNSLNRTLGWLSAGLLLYAVAVSFPFLSMTSKGISQTTALTTGIVILYQQDMAGMGTVVLLTCLLAPLFSILSLLYVLAPLRLGYRLPLAAPLFAWYLRLRPWAMMEVYLLGILISMVKLTKLAVIVPGPSFYSFIALIFVLASSSVSIDIHLVWSQLTKAERLHQGLLAIVIGFDKNSTQTPNGTCHCQPELTDSRKCPTPPRVHPE